MIGADESAPVATDCVTQFATTASHSPREIAL